MRLKEGELWQDCLAGADAAFCLDWRESELAQTLLCGCGEQPDLAILHAVREVTAQATWTNAVCVVSVLSSDRTDPKNHPQGHQVEFQAKIFDGQKHKHSVGAQAYLYKEANGSKAYY